MGLLTILRQMLMDLREQKLRTFLTLFGITWGTIAVSLLVAFGEGLHKQNLRSLHQMGERLVFIWPGRTTMPFNGLTKGRPIRVNEEDLDLLRREIPEARFAGEYSDARLAVHYGKVRLSPPMAGTSPVFGQMRNMQADPGGRFLNDLDMTNRRRVLFIGNKLKTDLFGKEDAIGKTVIVMETPFQVVGVLKAKAQEGGFGSPDGDNAWMPSTTWMAISTQRHVSNFIFQANDPLGTEAVKSRVYEVLGHRHQFDPNDKQAMGMWDTTEAERFMAVFFVTFRIFLAIVGACTLIVGGIGVSNIMYVILEERTREIGIKMALGAKPSYIQTQFVIETLLLTGVGGLLGFLFTFAMLAVIPSFKVDQYIGTPEASPTVLLCTSALLGLVGLISGYFPARRASMLDPVVALKLS